MAIKNGEEFLREQLASILPQLAGDDEVIISDDHSTDHSVGIVESFNDRRLRVLKNPGHGIILNFENALLAARGTYIFLADQDDVWMADKVASTMPHFATSDLLVSDCVVANEKLSVMVSSFYRFNDSKSGVVRNLFRNSYMGCCMAFHRKVAEKALPFPRKIPMHDVWLGLVGEVNFRVKFIDRQLVVHRRHGKNASTNAGESRLAFSRQIGNRFWLVKEILELTYAA